MDKRYEFEAVCPECNEESIWLFGADKIGKNLVSCEHCGGTYVVEIKLIPKTTAIYKVVKQNG